MWRLAGSLHLELFRPHQSRESRHQSCCETLHSWEDTGSKRSVHDAGSSARKESCKPCEIVAVFRSTDFDTVERGALLSVSPSVAPLLASLKVKYLAGVEFLPGLALVRQRTGLDPWDAASVFTQCLRRS